MGLTLANGLRNLLCVVCCVCLYLGVHKVESAVASTDTIRPGVQTIKNLHQARFNDFNQKKQVLDHTIKIYDFLKNPDNVSSVHYANTAEKEIIFKVIIASAILHGPVVGSDYDSNLDFYESNADFQGLTGDKKTHFEIIRDLNRFAKAAVKSSITRQKIIDGKLNNLTEVLKKSGVSADDFF